MTIAPETAEARIRRDVTDRPACRTVTDLTVTDLVEAARQRDAAAYEELVHRFESLVWRVVRGYRLSDADAHDAVQSTWLRLVEGLDRLRDPRCLPGWLSTAARRECLHVLRRKGREVAADEWLAERPDETAPTPEEHVVGAWMATAVWQQVAELPGRGQALVAALCTAEPPAYSELARRTGMPVGSIGPTRGRYLRRLRSRMELAGLGAECWL